MNSESYLEKWEVCKRCIKEICKNVHDNTDVDYVPLDSEFRFLVDGVNFNIDTMCMASSSIIGHSISPRLSGPVIYENKSLLLIFTYILNDFKELQLEDAIKITNLRNKQLKFMVDKGE